MRLILVRHAIALDGADDDARPISDEGRRRFRSVVKALSRLELGLDRIVHSPKLRALQTADLLTPLLRDGGTTEVSDLLADVPGVALVEAISGWEGDVAVVGHEPYLTLLLSWLITGEPASGGALQLKKGGVAFLEGTPRPGEMVLTLLLTPKVARRLG